MPDDLKVKIVADTLRPDATVNDLAARHGLPASHNSAWRQMARAGKPVCPAPGDAVEFVPLMVAPPEPAAATGWGGGIEIAVGVGDRAARARRCG
ncbi:transposase [Rhodovulum kholense]|uniref:transposase n=1 Tax=Rhodovulum kholense TaxID=453584 RepID=UPI000D3B0D98|nr:transposase [Rhodovulum kholense]